MISQFPYQISISSLPCRGHFFHRIIINNILKIYPIQPKLGMRIRLYMLFICTKIQSNQVCIFCCIKILESVQIELSKPPKAHESPLRRK